MAAHPARAALAALVYAAVSLAYGGCPSVLTSSYDQPVVGAGYTAQLIVNGLKKPRGIIFDTAGGLLVVEAGSGIRHITFNDRGDTCLSAVKSTTLIAQSDLNHGIELSLDGKTLYASSAANVYSWAYDPAAVAVSGQRTLVQNMTNDDHVSRTLLLPKKAPGMLLVSRGSSSNMDDDAKDITSGHSQIRAFNISAVPDGKPYDYPSGGTLIGWGLRNSAGVAEEPTTGGIFSVENSADYVSRLNQDIHQDDPGEEMNFHGFLNGSSSDLLGANYGYPDCFALWGSNIPSQGGMVVGSQFALNPNTVLNDTTCSKNYISPRLTFQAHTAPLDIKFTAAGTEAYVTFHGSWNRDVPVGYKLSVIPFANGQPTDGPTSTTATRDVLSSPDLTKCPGGCFRPVGLAIDNLGRIFMTSDSTGEIYVLQKADMTALGGNPTGSGTLVTSTSSSSPNVGPRSARSRPGDQSLWLALAAVALSVVGGAMFIVA